MSPRKKKPSPAHPPKLSPWDVLALAQAEHHVKMQEQALRALVLEKQNLEAQNQVVLLRIQLAEQAIQKKVTEENRRLVQSKEAAAALSRQLAERHCFSWDTHSYNPDTGELVAVES